MAKTDGVARIIALAALGKNGGGSTGGTTNYLDLDNKPKINNVELTGNKTLEDLGINIPELPIASADTLGGIKIGENLSIDENGVVSASGGNDSIPTLYIYTNMNNSDIGFKYYGSTDEPTITLNEFLKNKIPFFNIMLVYNSSSTYSGANILIYPNWKPTDNIYDGTRNNLRFYSDVYYTSSARGVLVDVDTDLQKDDSGNVYATFFRISISTLNYLTKNNETPYTPTSDYNPATKKYVDDTITTAITTSLEGSY